MPLDSQQTCLIILGASDFPKSKHLKGSPAFLNAKEEVKNYFLDNIHLRDPGSILDLFDQPDSADKMDEKIINFLEKPGIADLFVYYVGHGSYDAVNGGFVLAIQESRDESMGASSITAKSLGKTLSKFANKARLYLILDCCFAANIITAFMAPIDDVIKSQIQAAFPEKGMVALCSSSKDDPSIILPQRGITMFTEGLSTALKKGSGNIEKELMSMREVGNLTFSIIKGLNPGEATRPEVHSPIMTEGDLADWPVFANYGFKKNGVVFAFNIEARKKEVENLVMDNMVLAMRKLLVGFMEDFDQKGQKVPRSKWIILASKLASLEERKPPPDAPFEIYDHYVKDRETLYGEVLTILDRIYPN